MERTVYSVSAENCPGSKQDSLISSGNSCSRILRQGGLNNMSALSWRHVLKTCREGAGLKKMETFLNAFQHTDPNIEGL